MRSLVIRFAGRIGNRPVFPSDNTYAGCDEYLSRKLRCLFGTARSDVDHEPEPCRSIYYLNQYVSGLRNGCAGTCVGLEFCCAAGAGASSRSAPRETVTKLTAPPD